MTKRIISVTIAICAAILAVMTFFRYEVIGEEMCIVFAIIFAGASVTFFGYALDGTKVAEYLSEFFSEEGGEE